MWIVCFCPHRVFDQDNNGYITRDELQKAMEMIGENVTESQVTEMLALADLDKDGKINYEGNIVQCYFYSINLILLSFILFSTITEFARLLL